VRVDELLDIAPADSGLDPDRPLRRGEIEDAVEIPEIQVQAAGAGDLSDHAETPAADRNGAAGRSDRFLQFGDRSRDDHAVDGHGIEAGHVVDGPGFAW